MFRNFRLTIVKLLRLRKSEDGKISLRFQTLSVSIPFSYVKQLPNWFPDLCCETFGERKRLNGFTKTDRNQNRPCENCVCACLCRNSLIYDLFYN